MKRLGIVAILVLSFGGIADSAYLAQHELFGTPLAEFGVLFYSLLFILAALELVMFNQLLRRALQVISFIGVIASLYFTFMQTFVIGAFCIYCVASALIALLIFICATRVEPLKRSLKNGSSKGTLSMPPSV